jgi:hypothetical protein
MALLPERFRGLPGAEIVGPGLEALARGEMGQDALLVAIGADRLRAAGIPVPVVAVLEPEHQLYAALALEDEAGAHSRYNALVRRLVSFERAAECAR